MQLQYYYKALGCVLEKNKGREVPGEWDQFQLDLYKVDHTRVS